MNNLDTSIVSDNQINVTWDAPYYINLRNDSIQYCITIRDFSSGIDISSLCGISSNQYLFNLSNVNASPCEKFTTLIFGTNIVGNGSISILSASYYQSK